jgi:hypothetical protein
MLRLSVTVVPDAWDSGGRLESSLIELLLYREALKLRQRARSAAALLLLSQRRLLAKLRLRETGR